MGLPKKSGTSTELWGIWIASGFFVLRFLCLTKKQSIFHFYNAIDQQSPNIASATHLKVIPWPVHLLSFCVVTSYLCLQSPQKLTPGNQKLGAELPGVMERRSSCLAEGSGENVVTDMKLLHGTASVGQGRAFQFTRSKAQAIVWRVCSFKLQVCVFAVLPYLLGNPLNIIGLRLGVCSLSQQDAMVNGTMIHNLSIFQLVAVRRGLGSESCLDNCMTPPHLRMQQMSH